MDIDREVKVRDAIKYCIENFDSKTATNRIVEFWKDELKLQNKSINYSSSSTQLMRESKSFLNIKTISDLEILYPNQSSYGIKCDNEYIHFFVNNKKVLTKALIV